MILRLGWIGSALDFQVLQRWLSGLPVMEDHGTQMGNGSSGSTAGVFGGASEWSLFVVRGTSRHRQSFTLRPVSIGNRSEKEGREKHDNQ
jgi:hypothetical protein